MNNRRKFIKNTGLVIGVAPFLSYMESIPETALTSNVELEIYNTNWGFQGGMELFIQKSKDEGYDGIEVWVPADQKVREELLGLVEKYSMKLGLLAGNSGSTVEENMKNFMVAVENAISCSPEFINCHSGKDFYTPDQNSNFIKYTIEASKRSSIPIYHETHRGRILYNTPIAEYFIDLFPELQLTLDISHWTVVHESLLADQKEAVDKALARTGHIHSRIGFQEGPQIPNADDNQFEGAIKAHFEWWDAIVKMKTEKGEKLTMTTEFGPPHYMWTEAYSGKPLADNWKVNIAMKEMWQKRYLSK